MRSTIVIPAKAGISLTSCASLNGDSRLRGNDRKHGFSLIELSIGLVIIGLLVGGILAGQSLIRAAEVRSVITDFDKYKTTTLQFRQKYDALPGDFANATATWGAAHATPATCATTASTGVATCDGDEDGEIEPEHVNPNSAETFRFWQHLKNAGFIEGSYTGVKGSAGNVDHVIPGTNAPAGRINNSAWASRMIATGAFVTSKNVFLFGGVQVNNLPDKNIFKPEEAWNVDTKLDDGKPGLGNVISSNAATSCVTTAVATTAEYVLSNSSIGCSMIFLYLE